MTILWNIWRIHIIVMFIEKEENAFSFDCVCQIRKFPPVPYILYAQRIFWQDFSDAHPCSLEPSVEWGGVWGGGYSDFCLLQGLWRNQNKKQNTNKFWHTKKENKKAAHIIPKAVPRLYSNQKCRQCWAYWNTCTCTSKLLVVCHKYDFYKLLVVCHKYDPYNIY